jgi:Trypsin-like peptidase domain
MTDQFETSVETGELSRYVVQLRHESGRVLGTGFFVAPRWILTCAHVVGEDKKVVVAPDVSIATTPLPASVDVASQSPTSGTSASLWPFPDLALVHLDRHLEHPSALLCIERPIAGVEWQAWGYSEREQGIMPLGSPASFRYEGEEADGYLKLKGGEAAPGLSGSPLVCPRRRAVVGVVAATRQLHSDMGAYAVPVAPLLNGEERLPTDLIAHGSLIRAMNILAVIRDGLTWHKVLPIHGTDRILSRPWVSFIKSDKTSPSDLLRAEFGVVPYLFREAGLQKAIEWCDQSTPMAIARIPGDGGAGKTRFALELCKMFRERGWMAGFWRRDKDIAGVPLPRLIVVDYAEVEELRLALEMLDDLRNSASSITPVRVLLLTRTGTGGHMPESVQREAPASLTSVLESNLDIDAASIALSIPEREELYRTAVQAFAAAWFPTAVNGIASESKHLDYPDLSGDRYTAPLEVLFEALDLVLRGEESGRVRLPEPVERVLEHERKYWRKTGPQFDKDCKSPPRRCRHSLVRPPMRKRTGCSQCFRRCAARQWLANEISSSTGLLVFIAAHAYSIQCDRIGWERP